MGTIVIECVLNIFVRNFKRRGRSIAVCLFGFPKYRLKNIDARSLLVIRHEQVRARFVEDAGFGSNMGLN